MKMVPEKEGRIKARKALMRQIMAEDPKREARLAAIQMLIPIGLKAVETELQGEMNELTGERYGRGKLMGSWGSNKGSVYLGDQKVKVGVPRVRKKDSNQEVPLASYIRLQEPSVIEEAALRRVMNGISSGKYEDAALAVPETFGISRDRVSKRFIRASSKKLQELMNRELGVYDIVAIILDGKVFGDNELIIALGVTMAGEKIVLGFIEAGAENFVVCRDFVKTLVERGLKTDSEILCVIDGAKGLRKGILAILGDKGLIQRCQWHKRENVLGYLNEADKPEYRRKLQAAYEQPSYEASKGRLHAILRELRHKNVSAAHSLEEGLEETLTLHRLGLFSKLGVSLKTTNCLENINRQLEDYTGRVNRWHNSDQRRRWVAAALLRIEPRLRKIKGHQFLGQLRVAMRQLVGKTEDVELLKAA